MSRHLTILESVDSTNNYAMARVRTGLAKHGDAFFAMTQLNGKGQRGKHWLTEPGTNIIITLVLRPNGLKLQQQFRLNLAVALAIHDFFALYAGEETSIKWPNDIYWRDRKAGGILIENIIGMDRGAETRQGTPEGENHEPLTDGWQWSVVGTGININQTVFPEQIRNAVSLKQITGKDWDIIELAELLCGYVLERYNQMVAGKDLLPQYNLHLYKKDQVVVFKKDNLVFEGIVKEVNALGQLLVLTTLEEHFNFGEIEWVV
ncbi:MAG: biotin--[acetyl-CoA-carboxylase] ligase [Bacteroidota bacterium]